MIAKAFSITNCRVCGSANLSWQTTNAIRTGIQQGRLTTRDVECQFFLGCDHCSETLATLRADYVAEFLNATARQDLEATTV